MASLIRENPRITVLEMAKEIVWIIDISKRCLNDSRKEVLFAQLVL